jgi:hypothetical protein
MPFLFKVCVIPVLPVLSSSTELNYRQQIKAKEIFTRSTFYYFISYQGLPGRNFHFSENYRPLSVLLLLNVGHKKSGRFAPQWFNVQPEYS